MITSMTNYGPKTNRTITKIISIVPSRIAIFSMNLLSPVLNLPACYSKEFSAQISGLTEDSSVPGYILGSAIDF